MNGWRRSYKGGKQTLTCICCGEVFVHYTTCVVQPGRKKLCLRCTAKNATKKKIELYAKNKKLSKV